MLTLIFNCVIHQLIINLNLTHMIFDHLKKFGPLTNCNQQSSQSVQSIDFQYLGLYFTADWCSSCVRLVKELPQIIQSVNQNGNRLKLITLRMDQSPTNFAYNYWKFQNCKMADVSQLANILLVRYLPTILIYNIEGRLVSRNGLLDMKRYGSGTIQYWNKL